MTATDAPTLAEYAAGQAAQAGIAQADEHADDQWKRDALEILRQLARERRTIVSDDVWSAGLDPNPTGSNTALGGIFRAAALEGLIVKTDRVVRTAQVASHGSPMTVWRSLLHPDYDRARGDRYDVDAALDLVDYVLDVLPPPVGHGNALHRIVERARRARP